MLDSLIVSLRPKQWYKNVVVFAGKGMIKWQVDWIIEEFKTT